jgi:hypothetical protein
MLISTTGIAPYIEKKYLKKISSIAKINKNEILTFLPGHIYPHFNRPHVDILKTGFTDPKSPISLLSVIAYDRYGKELLISKFRRGKWRRIPYIVVIRLIDTTTDRVMVCVWNARTGSVAGVLNDFINSSIQILNKIIAIDMHNESILNILTSVFAGEWDISKNNPYSFYDKIENNIFIFKKNDLYFIGKNVILLNNISKIAINI